MPRYGQDVFGGGLYGPDPATSNLLWSLEVDWDADDVFSGANESSRMVGLETYRGRDFYLAVDVDGRANGFQPYSVGRADITLDNHDGRYDPFCSTSPLYPNVAPGRKVRLRVKNGSTGDRYDVFAGTIEDIRPFSGGERRTRLICKDGWRALQNNEVTVAIKAGSTADDIIDAILDDAGWPDVWGRDVGNGVDVYPYWWADDQAATTALREVADAELGRFWITADGKATYRSRHAVDTAVLSLSSSDVLKEIATPMPWETVRDVAHIRVYPRVEISSTDLWTLRDIPLVPAGGSLTIWADLTNDGRAVPATAITDPDSSSDLFRVNAQQNGLGADLTTDYSVAVTPYGTSAKCVITSAGAAGYITLLRLAGTAIDAPDAQTMKRDRSSGAGRVFTLDLRWQQDTTIGQAFADYLSDLLHPVRVFPVVQMRGLPGKQFTADVGDRIALTIPTLGISVAAYRVGLVEHRWMNENGQDVLTRIRTEPYADLSAYWIFPTKIGTTSIFSF